MSKEISVFSVLGTRVKMTDKEKWEMISREISTLRIYPIYDPQLDEALSGLIVGFENTIEGLIKDELAKHGEIINNLFDESGRVFNFYIQTIKGEVIDDIRNEMHYLVTIIKLEKSFERTEGNIVSYNSSQGMILNRDNLKSRIRQKKLALSLLILIIKQNNSNWLEEYMELSRGIYVHRTLKSKRQDQDTPEYYITAAISLKGQLSNGKSKANVSLLSRSINLPRTTLIDRLIRLQIYDKVKSILRNDEKPST